MSSPPPTVAPSALRARRMLNGAALAGVLVWLITFAAGPILHQVGHTDDHLHLPNGAIVRVDAPDTRTHDDHAPDSDVPEPGAPLDHGAGSLAHLGASAVLSVTAALPLDVALLAHASPELAPPPTAPAPRWCGPRAARGPPALIA